MTKFRHIRTENGSVTLAWEDGSGYIRLGIATCSPKDSFCKKTGRMIAENRMNCMRTRITLPCIEAVNGVKAKALMRSCPRWARNLLIEWGKDKELLQ